VLRQEFAFLAFFRQESTAVPLADRFRAQLFHGPPAASHPSNRFLNCDGNENNTGASHLLPFVRLPQARAIL